MVLTIVALNVLVFVGQLTLPAEVAALWLQSAGAIPRELTTGSDLPPAAPLPVPLTILTSMFLHVGPLHLLGNMWFLWLFGDGLERHLGKARFASFYVVTGTIGAVAQALLMPLSVAPMVGASGAVSGVLGGYALALPHARITTLVAVPFFFHLAAVPAWLFVGLWLAAQFLFGAGSGLAWMAHVGGFLAGLGLVRLFARQKRPELTEPLPVVREETREERRRP